MHLLSAAKLSPDRLHHYKLHHVPTNASQVDWDVSEWSLLTATIVEMSVHGYPFASVGTLDFTTPLVSCTGQSLTTPFLSDYEKLTAGHRQDWHLFVQVTCPSPLLGFSWVHHGIFTVSYTVTGLWGKVENADTT